MKKADMLALLENIRACGEVNYLNSAALSEAINDLSAEIRQENNRLTGSGSLAAAAGSILKSGKASGNRSISGAWTAENGRQYVCDGFRVLEILSPLDLEPLPDGVKPVDAGAFFKDELVNGPEVLDLPTAGELKTLIQGVKADARMNGRKTGKYFKVLYKFPCGLALNAEYLLNAIQATGANHLRTSKSSAGRFSCPCYLVGDAARVCLLPVNSANGPAGCFAA